MPSVAISLAAVCGVLFAKLLAGRVLDRLGSLVEQLPHCALSCPAQVLSGLRRLTHLDLSGCDAITGAEGALRVALAALAAQTGFRCQHRSCVLQHAVRPCPDTSVGPQHPRLLVLIHPRVCLCAHAPTSFTRPRLLQTRRLRSCCPHLALWSTSTCRTVQCRTMPAPCWPLMRPACAGSGGFWRARAEGLRPPFSGTDDASMHTAVASS